MNKMIYFYQAFRLGPLSTNCYLIWDENQEAVLIDTAGKAEVLWEEIQQRKLKLRYIMNTHGHFDHISCNAELTEISGALVAIHEADAAALTDNELNLAGHFAPRFRGRKADRLLRDGDTVCVGTLSFSVVHTPGHTPGGICLISDELLFSGDTLFANSVGRSDLVGGDAEALLVSLREKIWPLQRNYKILPGHGAATTLEAEKNTNPWMRKAAVLCE